VFTLYGIRALEEDPDFPHMSLEQLEKSIAPAQDESIELFMREIRSIKDSLKQLDRKIENTITSKTLILDQPNNDYRKASMVMCEENKSKIYPSWWGPPDSSRFPKKERRNKENKDENRYQHEMEVTALAIDNARKNALVAERKPITMVFEKDEFSKAKRHVEPTPHIFEKPRKSANKPVEINERGDPLVDLRKSQSQFYASENYTGPVKERYESFEKEYVGSLNEQHENASEEQYDNPPYERPQYKKVSYNQEKYEEEPYEDEEYEQQNSEYESGDSQQYEDMKRESNQYESGPYGSSQYDNDPTIKYKRSSYQNAASGSESVQHDSINNEESSKAQNESIVDKANNYMANKIIRHFSQDSGSLVSQSEEASENSQTVHANQELKSRYTEETIPRNEEIYNMANRHSYTYTTGSPHIDIENHATYGKGRVMNRNEFTLRDNNYSYEPSN
jgi:hypothetical protein